MEEFRKEVEIAGGKKVVIRPIRQSEMAEAAALLVTADIGNRKEEEQPIESVAERVKIRLASLLREFKPNDSFRKRFMIGAFLEGRLVGMGAASAYKTQMAKWKQLDPSMTGYLVEQGIIKQEDTVSKKRVIAKLLEAGIITEKDVKFDKQAIESQKTSGILKKKGAHLDKTVYLYNIAVNKDQRRLGIARALVHAKLELAHQVGFNFAVVDTSPDYKDSAQYKNFLNDGWQKIKRTYFYDGLRRVYFYKKI